MTPLADLLRAEISRRGPITFAEYMQAALYHPEHGYYAADEVRTGRSGHFVTSPELDATFGELWTGAFRRVWEACDRPERFHVVEIGPGEGGFARSVLAAAGGGFGKALRYVLVEPREASASRQRAGIADPRTEWRSTVAEVAVDHGCVFANEVLDNQPVHLVRSSPHGSKEVFVGVVDGELDLLDGPVSSPAVEDYLRHVGLADRTGPMQVGVAAADLARGAGEAIATGAVFFVDYGLEAEEIEERGGNTVVTYSERGATADPLDRPGRADLTAHVDWTGVRLALQQAGLQVDGPLLQADVLRSLGLPLVDRRLRNENEGALAAGDGVAAVRLLSQRSALGTLTNTSGLGGLQVMTAAKNLGRSPRSLLAES